MVIAIMNIQAQTAEVLFVNNSSGSGAINLDIEIRVMPQDTVYTLYSGVNFLNASTIFSVPASTILKFNYLESGSSTVYYSISNVVYNPGEFRIHFLYGTATSKRYSSFTAYQQSSNSSVIKYDFRHSTPTLQEIDLILRGTGEVLADNFTYMGMTTGFNDEFNASDDTLDVTPFDDNANGLFAYLLPGSILGGEYILLFTSGSGSANDMYMVQMNGTVTKLASTAPVVGPPVIGIDDKMMETRIINLYPIPVKDLLNISLSENNDEKGEIILTNLAGQIVFRSNLIDQLDISKLNNGIYLYKVIVNGNTYNGKVVVAK